MTREAPQGDASGPVNLDYAVRAPRGTLVGWLIAYVLFPYGPFVYLAVLRAISLPVMAGLLVAAAIVHVGLVGLLALTNAKPWQPWLSVVLLAGFGLIAWVQYHVGRREGVWSRAGRLIWACVGMLFVIAIVGVAALLLYFRVGF